MSAPVNISVRGALKVDNVPDRACFTSWQQFIQSIPTFLTVEVPSSVSNVIIGPNSPSNDDKEKLWLRRSTNGSFIGAYLFQSGAWRPLYLIPPRQVIWMHGDSNNLPEGFTLIEAGVTLPPNVISAVTSQYVANGTGGFSYFAVLYTGFS